MTSRSSLAVLALAGALAATAAACGDNGEPAGPQRLIVTADRARLGVGELLVIDARYSGGPLGVLPADDLAWTSSDPAIATVIGRGATAEVTAVAPGAATISAAGRGLTASLALEVSPAALVGVAITPVQPSVPAGDTVQLTATATYADGHTADVTVAALWTSDREASATVFRGLVRGRAAGDATITASFNGAHFASTRVRVGPPRLVAIAVTPDASTIPDGGSVQLTATGTFGDQTTQDLTGAVAWSSSAPAIATVSGTGLVSAVDPGNAAITATLGAVSGSAALLVTAATLESIVISPAPPGAPAAVIDVALGADQPLVATGVFSDQSTADVTEVAAWSSSNDAIAAVSNTVGTRGVVDARGLGAATITAAVGALSDTAEIGVFLAPVGAWAAAPGYAGGRTCADGVKLAQAFDYVYVCTATNGLVRGAVSGAAIAWASAGTGITNPQGHAVGVHSVAGNNAVMYMGVPQPGVENWFRANDAGATFSAWSLLDSAGQPRALYAGRFQPTVGNLLGSWDPGGGSPQAVVLTGQNPPTNVRAVGAATGTARSLAGSAASNLYVAVLGETPAGAPATGGVFRSTNSGVSWAAQDGGISAADKDRIASIAMDPADPAVLYAGVLGGGRVYKTTDGGGAWTAAAAGIPAKARVAHVLVSPASSSTVYAGTQIGLYRSTDGGATWALAGFQGRRIRGIAQSGAAPALILVAVDDDTALYVAQ